MSDEPLVVDSLAPLPTVPWIGEALEARLPPPHDP